MNQKITYKLLTLTAAAILASCGGGGGDAASQGSVQVSGQVVDGPIAGARVCVFLNGVPATTAFGAAICSSDTDTLGNYTLEIPRNLAPGLITLIASKGSDVKLASTLGTLTQVLEAAGTAGAVTASDLPAARVTHFTTADFALADTDNDGAVSEVELDAYAPDFAQVQKVAAVIKAVIDGGQAASLIGGQTTNTLALASAAARNQPLGSTNKTADQWLSDPANATILAAVTDDVAKDLESSFAKYEFTPTITQSYVPDMVTRNNGTASMYCGIDFTNESHIVEIAFDATRRVAVFRAAPDAEDDGGEIAGSYDPKTGAIVLNGIFPREVALESPDVTFYTDSHFKMSGTLNTVTGAITGTFDEMNATTWSLDSTRQECTAVGTFTATKL